MHAKLIDGQNFIKPGQINVLECFVFFFFSPPFSFLQRFRGIFAEYSLVKKAGGFILAGTY